MTAAWVLPTDAAETLRVELGTLRVIAHREKWRRLRMGREVMYSADDVTQTWARRTLPKLDTNGNV